MSTSKRELIWALLALAVFAALMGWLQKRVAERTKPLQPSYSTFSGAPDGCLALYLLLNELGMQPTRHTASQYEYPEGGCVVLLGSNPFAAAFSGGLDVKRARLWMEQGGTLILGTDEYLYMTPDALLEELEPEAKDLNSGIPATAPPGALAALKRAGRQGNISAMLRSYASGNIYKMKDGAKLWAGVESLEVGHSGYGGNHLMKDYGLDTLLATYDPNVMSPAAEPLIRHKAVGKGGLFILDCPEILTNSWLDSEDNHRAALALIALAARGRTLSFDEQALGYRTSGYNGLTIITRTLGGRLLIALVVVLAMLWLGEAIRPARSEPRPPAPRRQSIELVHAQAGLLLRAGARHTVAAALVDGLRRHCAESGLRRAPGDAALADWARRLMAERGAPRVELDALAAYLAERLLPRSGVEITALARACDYLRESLAKGEGP
jgi:hypothetical protein